MSIEEESGFLMEKKAFVNYRLPEEKEEGETIVVSMKLNSKEQAELKEDKKLLLQSKDSTAIKQLARIGAKVLREEKMMLINEIIVNNYRKNKRNNIIEFD